MSPPQRRAAQQSSVEIYDDIVSACAGRLGDLVKRECKHGAICADAGNCKMAHELRPASCLLGRGQRCVLQEKLLSILRGQKATSEGFSVPLRTVFECLADVLKGLRLGLAALPKGATPEEARARLRDDLEQVGVDVALGEELEAEFHSGQRLLILDIDDLIGNLRSPERSDASRDAIAALVAEHLPRGNQRTKNSYAEALRIIKEQLGREDDHHELVAQLDQVQDSFKKRNDTIERIRQYLEHENTKLWLERCLGFTARSLQGARPRICALPDALLTAFCRSGRTVTFRQEPGLKLRELEQRCANAASFVRVLEKEHLVLSSEGPQAELPKCEASLERARGEESRLRKLADRFKASLPEETQKWTDEADLVNSLASAGICLPCAPAAAGGESEGEAAAAPKEKEHAIASLRRLESVRAYEAALPAEAPPGDEGEDTAELVCKNGFLEVKEKATAPRRRTRSASPRRHCDSVREDKETVSEATTELASSDSEVPPSADEASALLRQRDLLEAQLLAKEEAHRREVAEIRAREEAQRQAIARLEAQLLYLQQQQQAAPQQWLPTQFAQQPWKPQPFAQAFPQAGVLGGMVLCVAPCQ